jgi:hypothetical protein
MMMTRDALMKAISENDTNAIAAAQSQLTPELLNTAPKDENTPLQEAVRYECLEIITLLLAAGADINGKGSKDFTPLMEATKRNQFSIVFHLLGCGADASIQAAYGNTFETFISTPDDNFYTMICCAVFYDEARRAEPAQAATLQAKHIRVNLEPLRVKSEYVTPETVCKYFLDVIVKNKPNETKKTLLNNALIEENAFTVFLRQSATAVKALKQELAQIKAPAADPSALMISSPAGMAASA